VPHFARGSSDAWDNSLSLAVSQLAYDLKPKDPSAANESESNRVHSGCNAQHETLIFGIERRDALNRIRLGFASFAYQSSEPCRAKGYVGMPSARQKNIGAPALLARRCIPYSQMAIDYGL